MNSQNTAYWVMENDMSIPQDEQQYQEENKSNLVKFVDDLLDKAKQLNNLIYEQ